jgi:Lsr2
MAQRVQYMLVDDVDGSTAVETVTFSLDGVSYEIDLTAANAKKLRNDFATWVGHARRSGGRKSSRKAGANAGQRRGDLSAVRQWARKNGHQVSDRGRISADILAAYDKAHS